MKGLKRVINRRSDALAQVGWDQLEGLLADHYRGRGYRVEHVGTGATGARFDGGIDLKLWRDDAYILVQCKHWNAMKVTHNSVHELLGLMVNEAATGAVLVTSGEFTKAAIEAATRQGHVQLIDGDELRAMIGPVPEPVSFASSGAHRSMGGGGSGLSRQIAERLLSAAEDRIRHGRSGDGRRTGTTGRGLAMAVLIKALGGMLFAAFLLLLFQQLMHALGGIVTKPSVVPAAPAIQQARPAVTPSVESSKQDPCHEVIDKPTGTYIDHCAPQQAPTQLSPAQLREQERRSAEAMKVISESTPEL